MKVTSIGLAILGSVTGALLAQSAADTLAGLRSENPSDRIAAYSILASKSDRTPDENTALVQQLLREDDLVREAFLDGPGASERYGEGYSAYVGDLASTVEEIAEREPDRSGVWVGLLRSPYNPGSVFSDWLARHADKTAPFLMAQAAGNDPVYRRRDAIAVLGEIVRNETDASMQHHLKQGDLDAIRFRIRAALSDNTPGVRIAAVGAVEKIGGSEDIQVLEKVASTDTYSVQARGPSGTTALFPVRVSAQKAAERLRKKLAETRDKIQ